MDLKELRDNLLRLLWLEQEANVPAYIFEDVTTAINSALQLLWQSPKDYFRNQELTATVTAGSDSVVLPDSIQEVIGPVWVAAESDREVHRILDQSDWNQFYQRFYGLTAAPSSMAKASYYFLVERNQAGEDNTQVTLEVKPTPSAADVILNYIASTEAPSYAVDTINSLIGTETIGVPHKYVESILLPIARWMATRSHFFLEKDKLPEVEKDAARALQFLDLSDPTLGTQSNMAKRITEQTAPSR